MGSRATALIVASALLAGCIIDQEEGIAVEADGPSFQLDAAQPQHSFEVQICVEGWEAADYSKLADASVEWVATVSSEDANATVRFAFDVAPHGPLEQLQEVDSPELAGDIVLTLGEAQDTCAAMPAEFSAVLDPSDLAELEVAWSLSVFVGGVYSSDAVDIEFAEAG